MTTLGVSIEGGELRAYRSMFDDLIFQTLWRMPPKLPGRRRSGGTPKETISPREATELLIATMAWPEGAPGVAITRARWSKADEAYRCAIEDLAVVQGGVPKPIAPLLTGVHILDALEALIRAAIDEPADFGGDGRFEATCVTLDVRTMEAEIDIPLYGELQRMEYGEPGAHRGRSPYGRSQTVLFSQFFAQAGRLFHMGAR